MAFFYLWLAFAVALCTARSIKRAIPGGSQYDQVRFMECENSGQVIGYYGKPPQGNDPPQYTFASWAKGGSFSNKNWDALCGRKPWVVGKSSLQCGLRSFALNEPAKTYIGNITYDGEGFNCFKDYNHAVHKDPSFGQCRALIYCTHQMATVVNIAASSDTITMGNYTEGQNLKAPPATDGKAAVAQILGQITSRISTTGITCDSKPVELYGGCKMTMSECSSTDSDTMRQMVNLLLDIYATNTKLFAVNDRDHTPRPNRGGEIRGYTRAISMPKTYTMIASNLAPPEGDGSLYIGQASGIRGSIKASIECDAYKKDNSFCTAMGAITTIGGGLGGGAGAFFTTLGAAIFLGCA